MERILILPKEVIRVANALSTLGKFIAFGFAFYLIALFFIAYNSPEKGVVFLINVLGEAEFEFYLMSVCAGLILFWMVWSTIYVGINPSKKNEVNE